MQGGCGLVVHGAGGGAAQALVCWRDQSHVLPCVSSDERVRRVPTQGVPGHHGIHLPLLTGRSKDTRGGHRCHTLSPVPPH